MDKSNLQFNFRGCSSKTCTSFECRRTSTTLFSEKNAMHTLWRYRSPTSTSYISALGMNRSKIQTVSETRGFYCYEKWPFIKQPKKGHFSKNLGSTPPLTLNSSETRISCKFTWWFQKLTAVRVLPPESWFWFYFVNKGMFFPFR